MARPAVAQDIVCALRHKIAKIEGVLPERLVTPGATVAETIVARHAGRPEATVIATGAHDFDTAVGGGLPAAGLTEIHSAASRDAGAAAGFALGLASLLPEKQASLLWIGSSEIFREAGRPYAPGLAARFGLAAERLLLCEVDKLADALWVAEGAAGLPAFAAVLLELRGDLQRLDLTATRRLHRRALNGRHPLLLIREAAAPVPTAAPLRLIVSPAPALPRRTLAGPLHGSIGPPAFQVTLSKSRTAIPTAFTLEWNDDIAAFQDGLPSSDTGLVVSVPVGGARAEAAPRAVVAFPAGNTTAGVQPKGKQHAAYRGLRHAG